MANTYTPQQLGIAAPSGGFQELGWYKGRQYVNGTLSDVGVIHPGSSQIGAGQAVSAEVNAQSAAQQGVSTQQFNQYLDTQRANQNKNNISGTPTAVTGGGGMSGIPSDTVSSGSGVAGGGFTAPATIDLNNIYQTAYKDAGITELEAQLAEKNKALIDASSSINENPYFTEATRVGRIAKLEENANKEIALIQNQIAAKKADVDTKLGIATKQFDINQSASSAALNQFNTLLSAGALDSANGNDIAAFAKATGLPSSFISSAVQLNKQKNTESKLIESTDDNGNVTVSLVQIKDGQMIVAGKQNLGPIGNKQKSGTTQANIKSTAISTATQILDSLKNSYGHVAPADWAQVRSAALQSGLTASEFNQNFSSYTDPNRGDFASSYGFDLKSRGASQYQIMGQE